MSLALLFHYLQLNDKSQAPEDGCTNIRNMLSSKWWNNKASDIKLVYLYSVMNFVQKLLKLFNSFTFTIDCW